MNDRSDRHLTDRDISRRLIEGPERAEGASSMDAHLQLCAACQAKMAEARAPLDDLQAAFVNWSAAQGRSSIPASALLKEQPRRPWEFWLQAAGLAMATLFLAALLIGSGILRKHSAGSQAADSQLAALSTSSDTAFMDQVDVEVSESVPDAMAPLTDLVAWDSTAYASEKRVVQKRGSIPNAKARTHAAQVQ